MRRFFWQNIMGDIAGAGGPETHTARNACAAGTSIQLKSAGPCRSGIVRKGMESAKTSTYEICASKHLKARSAPICFMSSQEEAGIQGKRVFPSGDGETIDQIHVKLYHSTL
jgi:hypothetical protein